MPKCALKSCRNNSLTHQRKNGISYFVFPKNEILREKWRQIVATERREERFKPGRSSVLCSEHFVESDLYYCSNGDRRQKIRSAVPQLRIGPLTKDIPTKSGKSKRKRKSKSSNDLENDDDDTAILSTFIVLPNRDELNRNSSTNTQPDRTQEEPKLSDNDCEELQETEDHQPHSTKKPSLISHALKSLLGIRAKMTYYKNNLKETRAKLEKKTSETKNLRRQNERLKKKIAKLKELFRGLNKEKVFDEVFSDCE